MLLASDRVHVTSEANTKPTMTAWTTMSAVKNIDHGDRSRGKWLLPTTGKVAGAAGDGSCASGAGIYSTSPRTTIAMALKSFLPAIPSHLGMPIELRLPPFEWS